MTWYRDYELEGLRWLRTLDNTLALSILVALNPCESPPDVPFCDACRGNFMRMLDAWYWDALMAPLQCDPPGACATHGRCWTHSDWDDSDGYG